MNGVRRSREPPRWGPMGLSPVPTSMYDFTGFFTCPWIHTLDRLSRANSNPSAEMQAPTFFLRI